MPFQFCLNTFLTFLVEVALSQTEAARAVLHENMNKQNAKFQGADRETT